MNGARQYAFLLAWVLASLLMLASCSAPLVPIPREPRVSRQAVTDGQLLEALRADWLLLQKPRLAEEERMHVMQRYNDSLLLLLRRYRVDVLKHAKRSHAPYILPGIEVAHEANSPSMPLREVYDDMVPAVDVRTQSLEEHYVVPGLGVPLVGIIPAGKVEKVREKGNLFNIHSRGTVRTLTAILEFPSSPAKPRLRFIPRHRQEYVRVGRMSYPLAGDFSAAIELYWNLTRVKEGRFLGLLRPQQLRDVTGLSCIEGYSPDKIPVILTHGLMSSAGTFDNLVNRLVSDAEIRSRYQFWYFNYPTGVTWTVSAAAYRQALEEVRRRVDPRCSNKNWDKMVVAGHSMGGLITHYSQCVKPWQMLQGTPSANPFKPYLSERYVDKPIPVPQYDRFRKDYFFRPVKAGMVIYMATPHRGAPLARYRLVSSLMQLVRLPENLVSEVVSIVTLQQDSVLLNPKQVTEWFTSVGQLSPDSYSIRGLQGLEVRQVPTLSIIGDRGRRNSPRSSDGVVPYWSSHLNWGSEVIVPADHSVQDVPETAEYLKKALKDYLKNR